MRTKSVLYLAVVTCILGLTQAFAQKLNDIRLEEFKPLKAPKPHGLLLKQGDRLAICGDSNVNVAEAAEVQVQVHHGIVGMP